MIFYLNLINLNTNEYQPFYWQLSHGSELAPKVCGIFSSKWASRKCNNWSNVKLDVVSKTFLRIRLRTIALITTLAMFPSS